MGTIWFWLVAIMLVGYVVLDGFDIGVGILHLWIARDDAERRAVIRSIGPVWDGNETWLIAAGGTLYFAFPALYAQSFSGFYLPLIMVLWLLILRGASLEFRSHVGGHIWPIFWDGCFSAASILLAIFYGAALGNIVRGVPFDANGNFFEPLWTNFRPRGETGILDWYTVLVGLGALAALALHGAAWLAYKTEGELNERALRCVRALWWPAAIFTAVITVASFRLEPWLLDNFHRHTWGFAFPMLAIGGLAWTMWFARKKRDAALFAASCAYIVGMLTSLTFSLYPNVLPSSLSPVHLGLTVANARAADYGLKIGLVWWLVGMALVGVYTYFAYRSFAGKISAADSETDEGY